MNRAQLKYYLLALRPTNLAIIAITQIVMMVHAANFDYHNINFPECFFIIFCIMFTAGAGYIINDIFDVESDSINKPHTRIVAKHITLKAARIYYVIVLILAIVFGFLTGWSIGFLSVAVSLLLYYYSTDLKGTVIYGNLLVSFLAGATVFTASQGSVLKTDGYFVEFAAFAFLITMAREIVKDMEDVEGDKHQEYETLPIKYGIKISKILAISFILSVIAFEIIFYLLYQNKVQLIFALIGVVIPLLFLAYKLLKSQNRHQYRFVSNMLKIIMLIGLVSVWMI